MSGPPPKYTPEERAKQGNPGKRGKPKEPEPVDDLFPSAPTHIPDPPGFLQDGSPTNTSACLIWNVLAEYLFNARLLRDGDAPALGRLCRYLAEWHELNKIIDDEGMVVFNKDHVLQRNPALLARAQIETAIIKLETQFGLTPNTRHALTKGLADSLKNLPLAGKQADGQKNIGPIGFLNKPSDSN